VTAVTELGDHVLASVSHDMTLRFWDLHTRSGGFHACFDVGFGCLERRFGCFEGRPPHCVPLFSAFNAILDAARYPQH